MVRSCARFTSHEIADLLCLSERTVRRYITLFHQTDIKAVSYRNGRQKDLEQLHLCQLILRNPCMKYNTNYEKLMVLESMFPQYVVPLSNPTCYYAS